MKIKILHFSILWLSVLLSTFQVFAYDNLQVRDPQSWGSQTGSIDQATITVRPKGLYLEYGLYLTYSARGAFFNNGTQLEIEHNFDLPKEAIVTDSWLWVGDSIIKAKILDQWIASQIYEGIVNRRKDPSILTKSGETQHKLKIYPLFANETRRVKITYLVPLKFSAQMVYSPIPTNLFNGSAGKPDQLQLLIFSNQEVKNPRILENSNFEVKNLSTPEVGDYQNISIPSTSLGTPLTLTFDSPIKDGIYLNRFEESGNGYYQLAMIPSQALDLTTYKKVAILLDYTSGKTNVSLSQLKEIVKTEVKANFLPSDSLNILYNNKLDLMQASPTWIKADSAGIEKAFAILTDKPLNSYSDLVTLLKGGIDFVRSNGNNGSIVLLSASEGYTNQTQANDLINAATARMNPIFPIHIVDFVNTNYSNTFMNGTYYYGNEYFNTALTRATIGNYFNIRKEGNFSEIVRRAFLGTSGTFTSFDLYTSLKSGFCYDRYYLNPLPQNVSVNQPILQVGQYEGTFPFLVQVSGKFKTVPFSRTIEIDTAKTQTTDISAKQIIAGNHVKTLERGTQSNEIIREIVGISLKNRVLSNYTAYLALEPSDTIFACKDCVDETVLYTLNDDESVDTLSIAAAPNPFNFETDITINLPSKVELSKYSFAIYNMTGQVVKTFTSIGTSFNGKYKIRWEGRSDEENELPNGLYNFVMNTPKGSKSIKLVLAK